MSTQIINSSLHRSHQSKLDEKTKQLLHVWNDTAAAYPQKCCVQTLFEAQAARTPQAVAVACQGQQLTYDQLNRYANQLAHYLKECGVGPEVVIGIYMNRSLSMVAAMLGVLKAGGAYLPLDPNYPQQRTAYTLSDAQVPLLIAQPDLIQAEAWLADNQELTLVPYALDIDEAAISRQAAHNPTPVATLANLAYVIYTSGSTGQPKGVQVEHRSLLNLVYWHCHAFHISTADKATQLASAAFDAAVWEIWPYLVMGASLHLADEETRTSPPKLRDWLVDQAITISFLPTPLAERVLTLDWPQETALRLLLTGGDKLQHYPPTDLPFELINNYGPTENTVVSTSGPIPPRVQMTTPPPIGRPIRNVHTYVLDNQLRPVPIGEVGELYLGGDGVARGYGSQPGLTAAVFLPAPTREEGILAVPGSRLYRTGDLARYRVDGTIEFLGRADHQVKIRGFRIELGEIENVLSQHTAVRETAVLIREDTPGHKRLVAYVVSDPEQTLTTVELHHFLKQKLPAQMVPAFIIFQESLPLTPNGKVDRRALPPPPQTRPEMAVDFVAPRTAVEEKLAYIWAEVLELTQIGVQDNFFELGGHSLLATQVVSQIRRRFDFELPLFTFFESPTIAQIADVLQAKTADKAALSIPPIEPGERPDDLPLSFIQEQVWFLQQLNPTSNAAYSFQAKMVLTGSLKIDLLERSLSEIVRRHETFRTTFPSKKGQPIQKIHEPWSVKLPPVSLRHIPEAEQAEVLAQRIAAELEKPFHLDQLPLVRWRLFQVREDKYVLLHIEHHLIHDGWSFNVFLNELIQLYTAFAAGEPSPLEELPVQYADFVLWQRRWLQGEVLEREIAYWQKTLAGSSPMIQLPYDRPRPEIKTYAGNSLRLPLPLELGDALRKLCQEEGKTLYMVMLSAFLTLLHRYSQQSDLTIGSSIANRRWSALEDLIGMFVNTTVLRHDLSGDPTFSELLERVRQVTLDVYKHQDVPFEKIVQALNLDRHLSQNPLFQVMFGFHDSALPYLHLPDVDMELVEGISNKSAKFDLNLIVIPRLEQAARWRSKAEAPKEIIIVWEYNTDLFDQETIERMAGHFQRLLAGIVQQPQQPLSALPILTQEEAQARLPESDTPETYAANTCLHRLFEAQVVASPEQTAVVFEESSLSYQALNERANQLAHYLQERGVGPDSLVGIYLERSLDVIVSILAVLKAGGAYLPLDPIYPEARLHFMMTDAAIPILLTQESLVSSVPERADLQVICVDQEGAVIGQGSRQNLETAVQPHHLAYVIYTSGSTGQPKGVLTTHENVTRLFGATQAWYAFDAQDVWTLFHSYAFDFSVWEIWGALLYGGRLVVVPYWVSRAPDMFYELLVREGVTVLNQTPSAFRQLMQVEERVAVDQALSLRLVIFGGEALDIQSLRPWFERHGDEVPQLVNMYGITETTVHVTYRPLTEADLDGSGSMIGRAIPDLQVYLLDRHLQPVPIGVPGEMYVGGAGLARGYLNRPDLTQERFVANPFSESGESRLYKTGDLARYRSDGDLEYLGRVDHQVKIRGFRIELGEIEVTLSQHPTVKEAVVTTQGAKSDAADKHLIAYITPQNGELPPHQELRHFLSAKLPHYMVPTAFVSLDKMPLTANGKVDRQALHRLAPDKLESAVRYVPPKTPIEKTLVDIWMELLDVTRVGIHDDFFELGGHSLLATRVISRIQDVLSLKLPLQAVFEHRTIYTLAPIIADASKMSQMADKGDGRPSSDDKQKVALTQSLSQLSDEEVDLLLENLLPQADKDK